MINRLLTALSGPLGGALIYLLGRTLRIIWVNEQHRTAIDGPVLYAFWHARMVTLAFSHRFRGILIMISESQDGEFIARPVSQLGFQPVRGSTTRSGMRALFDMVRRIKSGYDGAITPDGPKGPRHVVQIGTVLIAQRAGVPVIPIIPAAERCWRLHSWDRFIIPKPFSRAAILHGAPINVPRTCPPEELESKRKEIEDALNALTEEADGFFANGSEQPV